MKIIGITGPSGAGKSFIGSVFEQNGFLYIDGDKAARKVTSENADCLKEIAGGFPEAVKNGAVDRKTLAGIVFRDKVKLDTLNKITHKYIESEIADSIKGYAGRGVVIEGAALLESRLSDVCDIIIAAAAGEAARFKRITQRDGISSVEAALRLKGQHGEEYYVAGADIIVNTDKEKAELTDEIEALIKNKL